METKQRDASIYGIQTNRYKKTWNLDKYEEKEKNKILNFYHYIIYVLP